MFGLLTELDFSYNRVREQENLFFCQNLKSLQVLNITGNPIGVSGDYKELEQSLYQAVSAVVVNHPTSPPNYLRKRKAQRKDLLMKLPYPKPIASIMPENTKDVVTKHMYEAELSKGIAVPLGEIEPSKESEDEIFPQASKHNKQHSDIFTPPEASKREKPENKFFVTENPDLQHEVEGEENEGNVIEEEDEVKPISREEEKKSEIEEEEDDKDYGVRKMRDFMLSCKEFLGDEKCYGTALPISMACKTLKHSLKFPSTFVGAGETKDYMKPTVVSTINKSLKHQSKAILYSNKKGSGFGKSIQKKDEPLSLPMIAPKKPGDTLKAIGNTKGLIEGGKISVDKYEDAMEKILNISLERKAQDQNKNENELNEENT